MRHNNNLSIEKLLSTLTAALTILSIVACGKENEVTQTRPYQIDLSRLTIASVIGDSVLVSAASRDESLPAEWLGVQGILRAKSEAGRLQLVEWYADLSDSSFASLRGGADIELTRCGGKIQEANDHAARWILGSSIVSLSRVQRLTSLVIGPEQLLSLSEFRLGQQQVDIVRILKLKQLEPEFISSNPKEPLLRVRSVKFLGRTGILRIEQHPNGSLRQVRVSFKGVEPSEYVSLLEQIHDSLHVIGENHFDEGMDYTYFFRGDTVHCLNFYLGSCDYSMFHSSEGI